MSTWNGFANSITCMKSSVSLSSPRKAAWNQAVKERRCVLRAFRMDSWRPYAWSLCTQVKVGIDATVPAGTGRIGLSVSPGKSVTRCEHTDDSFTFSANPPGPGGKPIMLLRCENTPGRRSR
jgi:hypothetical protein